MPSCLLYVFNSKLAVTLLVSVASVCALLFARLLLNGKNKNVVADAVICSVLNSFLIYLIFDKIPYRHVYFFMLFFTLLINLEVAFVTNDSILSYVYVFFITLCDYSLIFIFSISIITFLVPDNASPVFNQCGVALSVISLVTIAFTVGFLTLGRNVMRLLNAMVHSLSEGRLLLYYSVAVSAIMCCGSFFIFPLLLSETTHRFQEVYYALQSFMAAVLFACSFFLLYVQVKLEQSLLHERNLSGHIKTNSMLNYRFNASTGVLAKNNYFTESLFAEGDDYYTMMQRFIKKCVHPEDQFPLLAVTRKDYGWERLATAKGNAFEMRCRISPAIVVWLVDLPRDKTDLWSLIHKEWIWINVTTVVTKNEMIRNTIVDVFFENIDEIVAYENSLREAASTDMLTGILNRGAFEFNISEYLKKTEAKGTLFMFDLDHFKEVNDTFGHGKGDEILKATANVLLSLFRADDLIGRLGGDEFVVFCKGVTENKFLVERAQRLMESVHFENVLPDGKTLVTSVSIGIALAPNHGGDFETLYHHADIALYKVKNTGRNGYRFYDS